MRGFRRKGQVAFIGECYDETSIRISPDMLRKGLILIGSWYYNLNDFSNIMKVIENSSLVDKLVSHIFPFSEIQKAAEKDKYSSDNLLTMKDGVLYNIFGNTLYQFI